MTLCGQLVGSSQLGNLVGFLLDIQLVQLFLSEVCKHHLLINDLLVLSGAATF